MYNHYTHQLLSLIITCHQFISSLYDAPTIPFSSWGWDPTSNIYFMTIFRPQVMRWVHPSPRPSKVSASPCATVSLWKNPLVAVEVLFHWLKPPMEVRHDHEVKPFGPGSFVHAVYPETCAPCVRFVMGHCDSQVYWTELDWRRLEDGLWFFAENDHSKTWSLSQVEELTRVARMYQHDIRM